MEIYKAKFKWSCSHNIEDWKKQNKNRIVFVSHCYLVVINFKPSIVINQCDNVSYSRLTCWTFLITPRLLSFTKRTMIVFLLSYLQRVRKSRWEQFLLSLSLSKYHIYYSVCGLWFPFTKQTVTKNLNNLNLKNLNNVAILLEELAVDFVNRAWWLLSSISYCCTVFLFLAWKSCNGARQCWSLVGYFVGNVTQVSPSRDSNGAHRCSRSRVQSAGVSQHIPGSGTYALVCRVLYRCLLK